VIRFLRNRLLRDTATLQVGTLLNALSNLAGTIAIAYLLGAREQGRFYVAIALYSLLWFVLNQGVHTAAVAQVAAATSRGLVQKSAAWLAFVAKAYVVIGLVLAAAGWLLLPLAGRHLFHVDEEPIRWALWLTISPLVEMPRVVAGVGLQGTRRMLPFARVENAQELARLFLVVSGALLTGTAAGAIAGTLLSSAVGSVVAIELYRAERRRVPDLLPPLREIARQVRDVPLRVGLPLGIKMGLVRSIDAIATQVLPSLVLQRFGTSEWVAYLRIAQRLMAIPLLFMQGVSRAVLPALSELVGLRDMDRFRRTYVRATLISGAVGCTALLLCVLVLPAVLDLTFPRSYREPVWIAALILLPGCMVLSFSIANDTFYLATDTLRVGVLLCVAGLLVNGAVVTLLAAQVPTTGVAWGLSFTLATSVMHHVHAALWFRRRARAGPGGPAPASDRPATPPLPAHTDG